MTTNRSQENRRTAIILFPCALVMVLCTGAADAQVAMLCAPGPPAVAQMATDCTGLPDGASCDDGNRCDGTDTCSAGGCAGTMIADDGLRLDRLSPGSSTALITWNLAPGATGTDLIRGLVSALAVSPTDVGESLLVRNSDSTNDQDAAVPAPGACFWYLVRGRTACGGGPWGFETRHGLAPTQRQPREGCVVNVNASPRYADHGMTVTDFSTCLEWEKKSQPGETALHSAYDDYNWYAAKVSWILTVNSEGFAGHNDWRVPSQQGINDGSGIYELQSIVDCKFQPTINPIFGPIAAKPYWSTTPKQDYPEWGWIVDFGNGTETVAYDDSTQAVRAVRGGP